MRDRSMMLVILLTVAFILGSMNFAARSSAGDADLKRVTALIKAGAPTRIYYLNFGSFDTHVSQSGSEPWVRALPARCLSVRRIEKRCKYREASPGFAPLPDLCAGFI